MSTTVRTTSSGALQQLEVDGLSMLLYPATDLEAGPANLWLRVRQDEAVSAVRPLTGPSSAGETFAVGGLTGVRGSLDGITHSCWFDADDDLLGWRWQLTNTTDAPVCVDVVCTLDVALTPWDDLRRSEYYVSQYLDLTPVALGDSLALAVRQNMPGERQPWAALGSSEPVAGWATDALQLLDHHRGEGLDLSRDLPGVRLQHEHTLAALQTAPITLAPGEKRDGVFWIHVVAHHPEATGEADASRLFDALAARTWAPLPENTGSEHTGSVVSTVFSPVRVATVDINPEDPAGALTNVERDAEGCFLSGFDGATHVVAGTKEKQVLRPHGAILHFSPRPVADGQALASTAWMSGVFASQVTFGPASAGERLSIRRSYLGLSEAAGARLLVARDGGAWQLLTTPSLWRVQDLEAQWTYRLAADLVGSTVTVRTALRSNHEVGLEVRVEGQPVDLMLVLAEEHDGLAVEAPGGQQASDASLFADGISRGLGVRTITWTAAQEVAVRLRLPVDDVEEVNPQAWRTPTLAVDGDGEASDLGRFLTSLVHDAAVHFQTPRGLEQYTGGAWGVRDVCQGPVGLLLATDETQALRRTLVQIFTGQQDDGGWPQWFHFLPQMAGPGHREAHGDVVYWPLLALAEYLAVTGDVSILDERASIVGTDTILPAEDLRGHLERAVDNICAHRTRDERLPSYGHGDWNDSLQPARPELAEQMCSTWTTELEIQSLGLLAEQLREVWPQMAKRLTGIVERTRQAFAEVLLVDDELAGYVVVGDDIEHLVHPRDQRTGLHHGVLQIIHAISDELLTLEQARHHQEIIEQHLAGPTGSYLFDVPVAYSGGTMQVFKRAEAATFWGREIGLMYTHAHVRHVEALTHLGMAEQMWTELMKVVPVGMTGRIPGAAPRQANCYYSSSDAWFTDRYDASQRAEELFDDNTRFEGGWRVYSSGPGLVLRLVVEKVLGVRRRATGLEIDPVLPAALDGLCATVPVDGRELRITYHVVGDGHGVTKLLVNGVAAEVEALRARYRRPGVRVLSPLGFLPDGSVELEVWVGLA
ncbi:MULTISPECIES: hypothetical protein [unclassified Luteococcus]|uniref:hypothetical protein n=1 Tax=unclassified Luteococcus TaxID=2639923 RepID=UPI00313BC2C9